MRTKKRAIVTEPSRPAKSARASALASPPGPLVGAQFIGAATQPAQLPASGPAEIAFAGRSNSGKSSAINALARRTGLAFASRTPGRTREINFFALRSGARAADLPGYGYAAVSREIKQRWQDFLWTYVTTRSTLVGLVLIVDARHGLRAPDLELLAAFLPSGRPVLLLATKSDKLNIAQQRDAVALLQRAIAERFPQHTSSVSVQGFSATTRAGVEAADTVIDGWLPRT